MTSITRFTVKLGVRYISNETLPSDKINKKIFFLADCFLIDINSQFIFQTQRKPFLQHYQPPKTTSGRPIANTSTSKASQGGNFKGELSSGRVVEGVLLFGWFGESLGAKAPDLAATKPIHSEL